MPRSRAKLTASVSALSLSSSISLGTSIIYADPFVIFHADSRALVFYLLRRSPPYSRLIWLIISELFFTSLRFIIHIFIRPCFFFYLPPLVNASTDISALCVQYIVAFVWMKYFIQLSRLLSRVYASISFKNWDTRGFPRHFIMTRVPREIGESQLKNYALYIQLLRVINRKTKFSHALLQKHNAN